jgi:hypothetical protein
VRGLVREIRITPAADKMELQVLGDLAALLEQEQGRNKRLYKWLRGLAATFTELPLFSAAAHYSDIGRPSIDQELMIRLIIGYCYGIRSERRLAQEVGLPRLETKERKNQDADEHQRYGRGIIA